VLVVSYQSVREKEKENEKTEMQCTAVQKIVTPAQLRRQQSIQARAATEWRNLTKDGQIG